MREWGVGENWDILFVPSIDEADEERINEAVLLIWQQKLYKVRMKKNKTNERFDYFAIYACISAIVI